MDKFSSKLILPLDPMLRVVEAYNNDPNPHKLNLAIGTYKDADLKTIIPKSIKLAIASLSKDEDYSKNKFMPVDILGSKKFRELSKSLLFGLNDEFYDNNLKDNNKVITVQTFGGSGGFSLLVNILNTYSPAYFLISNPTWVLHKDYLECNNCKFGTYYWDSEKKAVNFEKMKQSLESYPNGCYILLQPFAHNPTGSDLTKEEWLELIDMIKRKSFYPILNHAYLGLAYGDLYEETYVQRELLKQNIEFALVHTYSKCLNLYQEKMGSITFVLTNEAEIKPLEQLLRSYISRLYDHPLSYYADIISEILGNKDIRSVFFNQLKEKNRRIISTRRSLAKEIQDNDIDISLDYFLSNNGIFSLTCLEQEIIATLRDKYSIYVSECGRMNVTGINDKKSFI